MANPFPSQRDHIEAGLSDDDTCTVAPGHVVAMMVACEENVGTCSCGAVFRVPRTGSVLEREQKMAALLAAHRAEAGQRAAQWAAVRVTLQSQLGTARHAAFLAHLELDAVDGGTVRVSVPTRFLATWIVEHYCDCLRRAWQAEDAAVKRVDINVRAIGQKRKTMAATSAYPSKKTAAAVPPLRPADRLEPAMRLDNYVVYDGNRVAHAMITHAIAEPFAGPHDFNPIFVFGGVGLGKTHLLQSAVAAVAADASRHAFYSTSDSLSDDVGTLKRLAVLPRLVAIDDVHLLGRTAFGALRAAIDMLTAADRQVVLSAAVPPGELGFGPDLGTRIGLAVPLAYPDEAARAQILRCRLAVMAQRGHHAFVAAVGEDVIAAIAATVKSGGRALAAALHRLHARFLFDGVAPTADGAREDAAAFAETIRPPPRIEEIQRVVARHFRIDRIDLLARRRTAKVVWPRQIAMYLAKMLTLRSLPEIGRRFGRDHTTVLYAVRKVAALIETDPAVASERDAITAELRAAR
jgi:chromosomal replication initiator protein